MSKVKDKAAAAEQKSEAEIFFDARAPFHWNKADVLRIMEEYRKEGEDSIIRWASTPQ